MTAAERERVQPTPPEKIAQIRHDLTTMIVTSDKFPSIRDAWIPKKKPDGTIRGLSPNTRHCILTGLTVSLSAETPEELHANLERYSTQTKTELEANPLDEIQTYKTNRLLHKLDKVTSDETTSYNQKRRNAATLVARLELKKVSRNNPQKVREAVISNITDAVFSVAIEAAQQTKIIYSKPKTKPQVKEAEELSDENLTKLLEVTDKTLKDAEETNAKIQKLFEEMGIE